MPTAPLPPPDASGGGSGERAEPEVVPPQVTASPQATVYRPRRRPGLTAAGVVVLGAGLSAATAVLSTLLTGGLGWVFGVPFVLVWAYTAWEVRWDHHRSAWVAPPVVLLIIVTLGALPDADGLRPLVAGVITALVAAAPMLGAAEAVVVALLVVRRRRLSPAERP